MKYFDWDEIKNAQLRSERDISFEEVVTAMSQGKLLDDIVHPNPKHYPGQRQLIVEIEAYVYLVPYIEDEQKIFLKTIYPSRKMTKRYLIEGEKGK